MSALIASLAFMLAGVSSSDPTAEAAQGSASQSGSIDSHRALLKRYCVTCHNERLRTPAAAPLNLDKMDLSEVGSSAAAWEKVVRKLRAGVMPPAGRPRPSKDAYNDLATWLETELDRAAATRPNPGRTDTFRRLSRTHYQNAVRDLLALDIDMARLLPADDSSNGFDHISVGGLSPTLLERYLAAAEKISRTAVGSLVGSPVAESTLLTSDFAQDDHIDGLPFGTRGGTLVRHTFPVDAEYEIQVRLGRNNDALIVGLNETHQLEVTLDGDRLQVFSVRADPPGGGRGYAGQAGNVEQHADAAFNVRVPVKAGPRVVGAAFLKKNSALVELARKPFLRPHTAPGEDHRTQPVVFRVTIVGPFKSTGPGATPSRDRIFVCRPASARDEVPCATRIFSTLARLAYRRPVTQADVESLMAFYREGRKEVDFESGIQRGIRGMLVSPQFLFRVERDPLGVARDTAYRVSELELASRLSFLLWSSIPDDELLDLAVRGALKQPAVLEQQVRRMLADPRARALVHDFAGQWLYLRNLSAARPNAELFPDFDEGLRQAFRRQTELFFESILREDRSVLDLLSSNYTFLNERLAKHYGVPNVYGSHFRRVTLNSEKLRGGLVGHGSILTVTAYPNRTSPVNRGKWILENFLGTPPPPPPPDVPQLPENTEGRVASMRERMEQHRANPACASCHSIMDPLGLALEQFDAVGRWRTVSEAGDPIDASGTLPDGTPFDGAADLTRALLGRSDLFVTTITEKLLTYALGRGLEYYDMPAIRSISRQVADADHRFSALVIGVVKSRPFQMRSSQS
jgi:mono/diheme cytochrome c family protein